MIVFQYNMDKIDRETAEKTFKDMMDAHKDSNLKDNEMFVAIPDTCSIARMTTDDLIAVRNMIDKLINTDYNNESRWMDRVCPFCGKNVESTIDGTLWSSYEPPYCPNCGKKLKKSYEFDEEN